MKKNLILGAFLSLFLASCSTDKFEREIALIPQVKEISPIKGVYAIKASTPVGYAQPDLLPAAELVSELINLPTGWNIVPEKGIVKGINLSVDSLMPEKNGYTLSIDKESVDIIGQSYQGVVSGIQTLRQLLPPAIELDKGLIRHTQITLPMVDIKDNPTYQWRGMMLDVSRHFYSVEEVKELLNWMSLYKMNKFHWHLTDDQGWRIEIKQYPLLTEKGAWRKFNTHDKSCLYYARHEDNPDFNIPAEHTKVVAGDTLYGGYYTQEQIKEVVQYASKLGIDVIPEIDMPGHFSAAIANYP
ncbi:MAG: family 20 glycosylhydrolase, partial [Bacteroidales bacterium]